MDKLKLFAIEMKLIIPNSEHLNKDVAPTIAHYESQLILINSDNKEVCRMLLEDFHTNPWGCSKYKISRFQIRYIKGGQYFLKVQDESNKLFYEKMRLFFSGSLPDDNDSKRAHDCGWMYEKLGSKLLESSHEFIKPGVQVSFGNSSRDGWIVRYHFGVLLGFVEHNYICINKHGSKGPIVVNSAQ